MDAHRAESIDVEPPSKRPKARSDDGKLKMSARHLPAPPPAPPPQYSADQPETAPRRSKRRVSNVAYEREGDDSWSDSRYAWPESAASIDAEENCPVCCGTGHVKICEGFDFTKQPDKWVPILQSRGCDEAACLQFVALASAGSKGYFETMSLIRKILKKEGAGYPVHNISGFFMKGVKDGWHNL